MLTWKENNLLRESEEKKAYWRWHTGFKRDSLTKLTRGTIALGAPENGIFSVSLKKSAGSNNSISAMFYTKEEAEEFAAKAFPEESGEAYPVYPVRFSAQSREGDTQSSNLLYFEVDTEFGKCLAARKFVERWMKKPNALDTTFKQYVVREETQDLADNLEAICKYELSNYNSRGEWHSGIDSIEKTIEMKRRVYGDAKAKSDMYHITTVSHPVRAYLYLVAYKHPEEFATLLDLDSSDWQILYKKVVDALQKGEISRDYFMLVDQWRYADFSQL